MTPIEFRDILRRLNLPQVRAARLLGFNDRTVRRWIAGEQDVPEVVARVLRAAERGTVDLQAIGDCAS